MLPLSRECGDRGPPPSSFCKGKGVVGTSFFPLWHFMDNSHICVGDSCELEWFSGWQKEAKSVVSGTFLLILVNLESKEWSSV